jgi:hypothetical protein
MAMAIDKVKFFAEIGYEPHGPQQWAYHNCQSRFKVPVCGRRFGKSTMAGRDVEPELFLPNRRYWIVGPNYDLGEKEFRVIWNDLIIGRGLGRDKRVKKGYNKKQGDMYIEFPWQTRIEVRSAQHPESLVGESLHGVIMSEAAKHRYDTWERYVRAALSDWRGWASFPTTPEGQNWLYKLWQFGRNPDYPDYDGWRFPSWDNRILYPGGRQDPEILLIENTTSREWFEQEIAADFTAFVGKIYGEFQEDTHVEKVEFNPAWPNYVAFDWGFVNPLAAVEFQVSPQDDIYVWRLHYKAYTTLSDHLDQMKARSQPQGYHIDLAFGDAADPEAALVVTQNYAPCIADPAAKDNWREGVELVKTFLKLRQVGEIDEYGTPLEAPKLFVDHSCADLIREFNNYKAPSPVMGRNPKNPRETASGIDDHALDALRYGLMHIYKLGLNTSNHLSEVMGRELRSMQQESDYFEDITRDNDEGGIFTSQGMEF